MSDIWDMSIVLNRLRTFATWTQDSPSPSALASAGFYASGLATTRCFSCGGEVVDWGARMDPHVIHRVRFPDCLFGTQLTPSTSFWVPGERNAREVKTLASSNQTAINLDQLRVARDKYPEYREMARRIATFKLWNGPDVDLYDLARAGLIYQEHEDAVVCYSCGGMVSVSDPNDDPLIQHQRWFPLCNHLLKNKNKCDPDRPRTCVVCEDEHVNVKFVPCLHKLCCEFCGKYGVRICPLCHHPIKEAVNLSAGVHEEQMHLEIEDSAPMIT